MLGFFTSPSIQRSAYANSPGKQFIIAAIIKFKAHKDNPDQIPIIVGEFIDDLKDFLSSVKP